MPKRVFNSVKRCRRWSRIGINHILRMDDEGLDKHPPSRAPKRWVWKQVVDNKFSKLLDEESV